jgi:hypothetical protein
MTRIVMATAFALAVTLPAVSAQAQAPRTFVSAAGSDSNPCSFAAPCRHFQAAVNATSAGGEVDALDPAGYGPITISQAVTIDGQGWSYIAPPANGNGITINAVSGNVSIHGVSLNGAGITGGTNGIVFNSGDSLNVADCVAQNFGSNGILIQPTSGTISFVIINTIVSNDAFQGIAYVPLSGSASANGVIDHVVATRNDTTGITINTLSGSGSTTVAISNSIASNNAITGIFVINAINGSAPLAVSIDNTTTSGNRDGIDAYSTSNVLLGRSVITGNTSTGITNSTSPNTFYSYKDNRINLNNGTNFTGSLPVMVVLE